MDYADTKRLPFARSYCDLVVYQKARSLSQEIFDLTKRFPKEEVYSLTSQWRRASRSVGAQLAEAWAKRRYVAHFTSKLTDAQGEEMEVQHWITTAVDCGYITRDEGLVLLNKSKEIGKMLASMLSQADAFCGEEYALKESSTEYFAALESH